MPTQLRSLPIRFHLAAIVSALYATRDRAKAFVHIEGSLRQGRLPIHFFSELFIHLSLFLGYPTMLDGLERLASLRVGVKPRVLKSVLALVANLVNQDARPAMETVDRIWQNRRQGSF